MELGGECLQGLEDLAAPGRQGWRGGRGQERCGETRDAVGVWAGEDLNGVDCGGYAGEFSGYG